MQKLQDKRSLHGMLRCMNTECGIWWHRDRNAARNIRAVLLSLLQTGEVPHIFRKGPPLPTPNQVRFPHFN